MPKINICELSLDTNQIPTVLASFYIFSASFLNWTICNDCFMKAKKKNTEKYMEAPNRCVYLLYMMDLHQFYKRL